MYRDEPRTVYLKDYQPPEFLIDRADLTFELDAQNTIVIAELEFRRNPAATRGDGGLVLHGQELTLLDIAIDGRRLSPSEYSVESDRLVLDRVADRFSLNTRVRIHPIDNTALEGLYVSGDMLCTQCEAEGFRHITYFLDRPDVMTRFYTRLIADRARYPVLLANGNPGETRELPGDKHEIHWIDPFPKPSYLFALVAGDLQAVEDRYTTASGRDVLLKIYVERRNLDKCEHAMRSLKKAMRWDEQCYGREYDLDIYMIVAVSHFNMGAMENKGLNVFNSKYVLARPDTATDIDFVNIEGVIAHEYFHNWTGNRITCRDWFQLSLKEGLTVYRDQEFSADMNSRGVKRIQDVRVLRTRQFPEDAGPLAHPVRPQSYIEINNFYTATVYEKGAELVRMQATLLGPERFRAAMDLYFARHDGQAITTDDFVRCMEEGGGIDLTQFRQWYCQSGTPEVEVTGEYDAQTRTYTLRLAQGTPSTPGQTHREPLHIPFKVGLLAQDGRDIALRLAGEPVSNASPTRLLELRRSEETYRFVDVAERPVPSLLRGFSAPVKVRYPYSNEELMFLMAHDSDGFNRWDAGQTLISRFILSMVEQPDLKIADALIAAFRRALSDRQTDPFLISEVLTLPSESVLSDQMEQVDIDGLHRARESLKGQLSIALHDEWHRVYEENRSEGPYDLEPESMGRRALKNLCMSYRMQEPDEQAIADCRSQFKSGHNMTDVIGALSQLIELGGDEREAALDGFYRQWSNDRLVLDKWFAIQAMSKREDTLERVRRLTSHPDFTLTNPNRVRSLVGAFCTGNPVRFNAADGSGYRFLSDQVLALDPINPQIAARLLQSITRWRRLDAIRQTRARQELERIAAVPQLSKDVYEVASKSLAC